MTIPILFIIVKPKAGDGCYLLSSNECCKYLDGRRNTAYYGNTCVKTINSNFPCEPLCWATKTCGNQFRGTISDYCKSNGKKYIEINGEMLLCYKDSLNIICNKIKRTN